MGRRRQAAESAAEGITDALVFSLFLLIALWILSLIFPEFRIVFGFGNSFLFVLAYFVARVVYTPVKAAVSALFG